MSPGCDGKDLALVIRVLRGNALLSGSFPRNPCVSPRYAPSWITYWNTATYPIRGMTPRSVDG